jgi:hypothetical protein
MIKAFITKFKIYIIITILLSTVVGTWKVRGWYEDGKVVTALKKQKKEYEEQADIDAKALIKALEKQEALRNAYEGLKHEAGKTKLCSDGGRDFLRLFNRSATAANPKK